ncbi:MAG: mobile mystery protein A [Terriglobia bacterium]|nr:mobile mystery protein A [Terriglobia bacterium]
MVKHQKVGAVETASASELLSINGIFVHLYRLFTVHICIVTVYKRYNHDMATKQTHLLAATQIDRKLAPLRAIAASLRPSSAGGWIRALRQGLGLSAAALGSRMRLAQQSVDQLEKNERAGAITLASLRRAAEALDAELFYAIIPRKPLRETIAERAKEVAQKRVAPVAHSMQLEAQGLTDNELQERITELAFELERNPRELWR